MSFRTAVFQLYFLHIQHRPPSKYRYSFYADQKLAAAEYHDILQRDESEIIFGR